MIGFTFGSMTVLKLHSVDVPQKSRRYWVCQCSCGVIVNVIAHKMHPTRTCSGCMIRKNFTKHGHLTCGSKPRTYVTWEAMKARCYNSNNVSYKYYGDRGIKVCDRWRNSYSDFLSDMGERPAGMEIDRIDNDGDYESINCRWVTERVQAYNRSSSKMIKLGDETKCMAEWCAILKLNPRTVGSRIRRGWSEEQSFGFIQ
jgi:hypothetical protein